MWTTLEKEWESIIKLDKKLVKVVLIKREIYFTFFIEKKLPEYGFPQEYRVFKYKNLLIAKDYNKNWVFELSSPNSKSLSNN